MRLQPRDRSFERRTWSVPVPANDVPALISWSWRGERVKPEMGAAHVANRPELFHLFHEAGKVGQTVLPEQINALVLLHVCKVRSAIHST
jgi:hypothetical protein